eukprot:CAMPEP_0172883742 /NCGR_PEP_ID=MMETSP1075-20121228/123388_1 /TAXON_ID=2916 /ORGANISM="Ceratium fusus, Strain PA161109" /LENGTH=87 /DNA_ID=CAMNT_0013736699 /DNA_START=51 /DNA_END=310 /DNA_ORIENTATION=-
MVLHVVCAFVLLVPSVVCVNPRALPSNSFDGGNDDMTDYLCLLGHRHQTSKLGVGLMTTDDRTLLADTHGVAPAVPAGTPLGEMVQA